jgi:transcriptional regulator of nitric oxide reductase
MTVLCGCGGETDAPDLVAATGSVFYQDKPISGATVTFIVQGAPIATAFTNATGGRPGAPLGSAKVAIVKESASASELAGMTPQDMADMAAKGKMKLYDAKEEIPAKYSNPDKSGLVATLDKDGDKNVFEFKLF